MDVYEKLAAMALTLPTPPARGGLYVPVKRFAGNLAYVSGCNPNVGGTFAGKLGREFTVAQGQVFARNCMLNVLAQLQNEIGDLRRVKSCVKVTTFVASADDFTQQPAVANGGTQLLLDIFGEEAGLPSRSAVGVNILPGGIPVETEAMFELYPLPDPQENASDA